MNSEKYLQWCPVENTVNSRLKDNSLVHTFTSEKRIRKSTKLINKTLKEKLYKTTYTQFKQCKQKILKQLTENNDVIDKSDFSDTDYKIFYDSFNVSCTKNSHTDVTQGFSWNIIDKKGRDHQDDSKDSDPHHVWEPNIDISVIKTNEDFEKLCNVSKIRKQKQIIKNAKSNKKETAPQNLIKSKNTTINSSAISNKEVSSVNSKISIRKKASTKEKQSPKSKQISNKRSKDVKKNLTSALDSVSLRSQEFTGDEWNDDFASTEFQAQSTQIFSDTFSEKKAASSRPSINNRLSHEVINQPRDSGIEEDSREDNAKFENPTDEKKYNKNQEDEKNDEPEEKEMDNLKVEDNNLNQNEIKKSPNKKVPLKIIGEERVTKKFKIITNKDKELKPIEEEQKVKFLKPESTDNSVLVKSGNEKVESSSESDPEFTDCYNADKSQYNKSDKDSSDEYYDLQYDGSEGDSEDSENQNRNKNDLRDDDSEGHSKENPIENENKKAESDNSSTKESIIHRRELKEELKRCKSPYMIRRYNELKNSGVLDESDVESGIKLMKNPEKKPTKKTLCTPLKSSKSKKTNQLKTPNRQDTPKTQKLIKDDESFEEKTLVAENFNDNSVLTHELDKNAEDIENDMEEATPNVAKLQQMRRVNLLAGNDESDNSEDENIHKNAENKAVEKESSTSPNSKQYQQQMKRSDMLSTDKDSDESESESKDNKVNKNSLTSNTAGKKIKKNVSSKIENLQNMSKPSKDDSDSIVSETTNSQSSQKTKQCNNKKKKSKVHKKLTDKDTSSAREESVEIDTQSDLKNVVNNYKQNIWSQTPKLTEDLNLNESEEPLDIGTQFQPMESSDHEESDVSENSEVEKTVINVKNQSKIQLNGSNSDSEKKDDSLKNESSKVNKMKEKTKALTESSSEEETSDLEEPRVDIVGTSVSKNEDSEDECIMSSKSKENLNKMKRLDLLNSDEDSDDSKENSKIEKTVTNVKNESKIQLKGSKSDSEKKDDSLKNESSKINKMKQKTKALTESSSEEETSDLEEPRVDIVGTSVSKNEDSEDECIMSSKSKENLNKMKRLDLLNSDEDSDDSKDAIIEQNHCNSDVDIEEHKIEDVFSCDNSEKKDKVLLNHLKPSDYDSSDKSDSEIPSTCKTNKSKSKHLSSGFTNFKDSGAVPEINGNSSDSSKNKSKHKRKFTQIDSEDVNDRESGTSQEIDVVHYSSENDINDHRNIKKSKKSNFGTSTVVEEENIDTLFPNSFKGTKLHILSSKNESDDNDSDQAMSDSSKQKILRLKKMNLLANNSSSSSEDEKEVENSQKKCKKNYKMGTAKKNSDLDSDSGKKKDLHDFNAKTNRKLNQVKENKEIDGKDAESDAENQKDDIDDDKKSKSEDSEEECTMSSKTKERLNKMKRLDLLNNDEDSDDSKDSIKDQDFCNSDVDIEEHKIEDIVPQHDLKKNDETLKSQINSSDSDSEKTDPDKSKAKTKNLTKEKLTNKSAKKLTSTLVPTDGTEIDDSFEKEKHEFKESKKNRKNVIIQETQEDVCSQRSILESQPMFSSLEDLREGIDEKQLNVDVESDSNANNEKNASRISPTQAPKKMFVDKIRKISELVEKESLEKIACQSTMSINNISADDDIFVFEVPKTIFNENLIGKKLSFSKTTLTVGNNKYEAFQKQVSPTYSCIFKTENKALDSFTTQNIRPVATIIARRKKFIDESAKVTDNETDEDIQEYSSDNETANHDNDNNLSKDKNPKMKATKKMAKKSKKSEEKEVPELPVKSNKQESTKKVKPKKNKFDIKKFVKKTIKASATDNLEKRSKKLHRKVQDPFTSSSLLKVSSVSVDDTLNNDEIVKDENLDNNNLSCISKEAHVQTTEKKTLIKDAINITSKSKDSISKKPMKKDKLKKIKSTEDVEESEDVEVLNKKANTKRTKKLAKSESKPLARKRKAESQLNEDANPDDKQERRKKKKVTPEKKEKKPARKTANPRNSKKKADKKSGESAADQIRKFIAKNIKFDESLNGSFDSSNYNPLDIERIPKKPKRCQSTTSNSSDDDSQFTHRSFHVRVKSKPEDDKFAVASSSSSSSADVKSEDKKSVKKVFFAE